MILEAIAESSFGANTFIVGSEATQEAMVIDPGGQPEAILDRVKELGLKVILILATHNHMDHIGAVKELKEATGAEFAIHADDAPSLEASASRFRSYLGMAADPPPPPERLLKGGDTIAIGDLQFTVLHTPGHTPGGICLLGHGVVFSGDTLFNFGIGRTDFPGGSMAQLLNNIHTKLLILPDQTTVLPGHGPATTIGTEREWNPFLGVSSRFRP